MSHPALRQVEKLVAAVTAGHFTHDQALSALADDGRTADPHLLRDAAHCLRRRDRLLASPPRVGWAVWEVQVEDAQDALTDALLALARRPVRT
jgi:hypothetical protein